MVKLDPSWYGNERGVMVDCLIWTRKGCNQRCHWKWVELQRALVCNRQSTLCLSYNFHDCLAALLPKFTTLKLELKVQVSIEIKIEPQVSVSPRTGDLRAKGESLSIRHKTTIVSMNEVVTLHNRYISLERTWTHLNAPELNKDLNHKAKNLGHEAKEKTVGP